MQISSKSLFMALGLAMRKAVDLTDEETAFSEAEIEAFIDNWVECVNAIVAGDDVIMFADPDHAASLKRTCNALGFGAEAEGKRKNPHSGIN